MFTYDFLQANISSLYSSVIWSLSSLYYYDTCSGIVYWIPVSYPLLSGIIQTVRHLSFCGPGSGLAVSRAPESLSQSVGTDCSLLRRLDTHPDTLRSPLVTLGFVRLLVDRVPCFLAKGTSAEDG